MLLHENSILLRRLLKRFLFNLNRNSFLDILFRYFYCIAVILIWVGLQIHWVFYCFFQQWLHVFKHITLALWNLREAVPGGRICYLSNRDENFNRGLKIILKLAFFVIATVLSIANIWNFNLKINITQCIISFLSSLLLLPPLWGPNNIDRMVRLNKKMSIF